MRTSDQSRVNSDTQAGGQAGRHIQTLTLTQTYTDTHSQSLTRTPSLTLRVRHRYITASRNGLNADELQAILSADRDVLASISKFHLPTNGELPHHLVFMLQSALRDQLDVGAEETIGW